MRIGEGKLMFANDIHPGQCDGVINCSTVKVKTEVIVNDSLPLKKSIVVRLVY